MKKIFAPVFLALILIFSLLPHQVFASSPPIRVAFLPDMHGFYKIEENGSFSGVNYDYLMNVAQYTGWEYEFVVIEEGLVSTSLLKAQEMLKAGEIDLLGPFSSTSANFDEFESGENNYGVYRYNLYSARNNYAITEDNYFLQDTLHVGLVESYTDLNNTFLHLMEEVGIPLELHYVDTHSESIELLLAEGVDAIINLDMSINAEYLDYLSTIQRIPFYFVSTKGNIALMQTLDEAIEYMEIVEPYIQENLREKYFGTHYYGDFLFTDEEQSSLSKLDSFKVGMLKSEPPYQFINQEGEYTGITLDILKKIEEILGIPFEFIWYDSHDQLFTALELQDIDMIGTIPNDYKLAHSLNVTLSNPYLSSSAYWLTSVNEVENPTFIYHFVSSNIPFFSAELLSSTENVLSDLEQMDKYGTYSIFCDPYVTEYYMSLYQYENIEVKAVTDVLSEISFGIGNHIDVNLIGMINRAILYLDTYEIDEIIFHNTSVTPEYGFWDFIYEHAFKIYSIILFFIICIAISVYNTLKRFKDLSRRDSLTKLFNSGYFHEYAEEKAKKVSNGALILIDIDYFKDVNDNHGHHIGDEIIKQVAKNMMKFYDTHSFNARVGGDEFAIFIDQSMDKSILEEKTKDFLLAMELNDTGIPITLSIGGFLFDDATNYTTLYKNADAILYKVKEKGRNGYLFE